MWFVVVIAIAALVVVVAAVALRKRRARRLRPAFGELTREDQVEVMRNRERRSDRQASREGAKHHGPEFFSNKFGSP